MRLVLDTNVWIDWLVFDDPSILPVKAAQRDGRLQIVIDDACLGELKAVLAYAQFGLGDAQKKNCLSEVDQRTISHDHHESGSKAILPRCSDPDDQKFLALARAASADWLLTRDEALLKLNRRLKAAGFRIGTPSDWSAACATPG